MSDAFEISLEKFSGRRFVVASRDEAIERSDTKKINKNNCQAYGGTIGLDGRQQCARARAKTLNAQARPGRWIINDAPHVGNGAHKRGQQAAAAAAAHTHNTAN